MQHHHRHAVRVAALLDIDHMTIAHRQHALVKRIERRIEPVTRLPAASVPIHHRAPCVTPCTRTDPGA
jgi:hypothetical protein